MKLMKTVKDDTEQAVDNKSINREHDWLEQARKVIDLLLLKCEYTREF